jgi:hypothetical protein
MLWEREDRCLRGSLLAALSGAPESKGLESSDALEIGSETVGHSLPGKRSFPNYERGHNNLALT